MDSADHAQQLEEQARADALARARRLDGEVSAGICIRCEDEIPAERMAALDGKAERCIDCQELYERALRGTPHELQR